MLITLLVVMIGLCWLQYRGLSSLRSTYATCLAETAQMQADAAKIASLQQAPRAATGRTRANEVLLAAVENALDSSGIDRAKWQDSVPQAPVRPAQSDYRKHSTRLYLEDVDLKELAGFVRSIQTSDPTLRLSSLHLVNRVRDSGDYDIDLALSYLVYAPQAQATASAAP